MQIEKEKEYSWGFAGVCGASEFSYISLLKSWVNLVEQLMVGYSTVRHTLTNNFGILMLGTFYSYSWVIFYLAVI